MSRRGEGPAPIVRGCSRPPTGWECTREEGHEGPCAARERVPVVDCPGPPQCMDKSPHDAHLSGWEPTGPMLGLATTDELIRELRARMAGWDRRHWAVRGVLNGAFDALRDSKVADRELAYRTVDQ